jgi:hypothetical protein
VSAPLRPPALVHRGLVLARALFFDPSLAGEAATRRRILARYRAGATLCAPAGGYLLTLPEAVPVDCRTAEALPLVELGGVLASAPLGPADLERLEAPAGAAVLLRHGRVEVVRHGAAAAVDPSAWLDLSGVRVLPARPLGSPPAALAPPPPPPEVSRAQLGVGAPDPGRAELLRSLEAAGREPGTGGTADPGRTRPRWALDGVGRGLLAGLAAWVSRWGRGSSGPGWEPWRRLVLVMTAVGVVTLMAAGLPPQLVGALLLWLVLAAPTGTPSAPRAHGGRHPPPAAGGESWLRRLAGRWLLRLNLAALLGPAHARYLRRLLDQFERGDLDEALRNAIPLGELGRATERLLALGAPGARAHLQPTLRGASTTSVVNVPEQLQDTLRQLYRRAFQQLEAQGRVEEAAFVLADLLASPAEAVSFLERQRRLQLAAELAEGRELPVPLVARQWVLAGQAQRAVDLARRSGQLGAVVLLLERSHPDQAGALRLVWADLLASAGDFPGAAEAVWPVSSARHLARAWVVEGLRRGGLTEARLLPRRLTVEPEAFPAVKARARELLADRAPETAAVRAALTASLLAEAPTPGHAQLARLAVRAALRDRSLPPARLLELAERAGDPALQTEVQLLRPGRPADPPPTLVVEVAEDDRGHHPLLDAALLPDGRMVVALGEAGVVVLRADGTVRGRLDAPAQRLVVAELGDRALAVSRRGEVLRLTRLDLAALRAQDWCDTRLGPFAARYDGQLWLASEGNRMLGLDALAPRPRPLFHVPDLPGTVVDVRATPHQVSALLRAPRPDGAWSHQRWTWTYPGLVLRERAELEHRGAVAVAMDDAGGVVWHQAPTSPDSGPTLALRSERPGPSPVWRPGPLDERVSVSCAAEQGLLAVAVVGAGGGRVEVLGPGTPLLFTATLAGAGALSLRLHEGVLVVVDDRGRVLVVDVPRRKLLRELRF